MIVPKFKSKRSQHLLMSLRRIGSSSMDTTPYQHCLYNMNQSRQTKLLCNHFVYNCKLIPKLFHSGSRTSKTDGHLVHNNENNEVLMDILSDDGIVKISLNRTKRANAMGKTMLSQLQKVIKELNVDPHENMARCVILSSNSAKVFSAGADLKERSEMSMEEASSFVSTLRSTFDDMANLPMPVIACVEGLALGGGLEIALTADIIIAGKNATFGLPETSLAIIPGAGGTQRLPRLVGTARAKELIFTGKSVNSSTALEYGMVQYEVDAGEAESKAIKIATKIVSNGPLALRAAKKSINEGMNMNITEGLEIERQCYASILPTNDRLEGLQAFKEKRKPNYSGE